MNTLRHRTAMAILAKLGSHLYQSRQATFKSSRYQLITMARNLSYFLILLMQSLTRFTEASYQVVVSQVVVSQEVSSNGYRDFSFR